MLEKLFKLRENGTDAKTEVMAGITTFMTMAYQNPGSHCRRNYYCFDGVGSNADTGIWKSADGRNCNRRNHAIGTGTCFCKCNP